MPSKNEKKSPNPQNSNITIAPSKPSQNKTVPTKANVDQFLQTVNDPQKRDDSYQIINWMKEITGENPVMWGSSIIGFGTYHYKYPTGREGDMPLAGFSPRKQNLTIYLMPGFESEKNNLEKLGKYKVGKVCLYINHLKDVNTTVLKTMITDSVNKMKKI